MKPWKWEVHVRCNYSCQDCGVKEDIKQPTLQVHHIKPLSVGGTNDPSNTTLLCDFCHKTKHQKVIKKTKYYERIYMLNESCRVIGHGPQKYHYFKKEKIHRKGRRMIKAQLKLLC